MSPLTDVLACLFWKFLGGGHFKNNLPQMFSYFRYINGFLLIYAQSIILPDLVNKIHKDGPTILVTFVSAIVDILAFVAFMRYTNNNEVMFSGLQRIYQQE